MTYKDLAESQVISERSLANDLTKLTNNGIELLKQKIQIDYERENGEIYFEDTVHPIFLPLNLTEVYALTVGLKKISNGTEYKEILHTMADWIFSQLTDYGKDIIKNSIKAQGKNITFMDITKQQYKDEETFIKERREFRLIHLEKSQRKVRITHKDVETGKVKVQDGTVYFENGVLKLRTDKEKIVSIDKNNITDMIFI